VLVINILYKLDEKEVLKEKILNDGFKIILARWVRRELKNKVQYITWLLNPETNVTYLGNYYDTFDEADDNYLKRIT
jgi:hypothetical protein